MATLINLQRATTTCHCCSKKTRVEQKLEAHSRVTTLRLGSKLFVCYRAATLQLWIVPHSCTDSKDATLQLWSRQKNEARSRAATLQLCSKLNYFYRAATLQLWNVPQFSLKSILWGSSESVSLLVGGDCFFGWLASLRSRCVSFVDRLTASLPI